MSRASSLAARPRKIRAFLSQTVQNVLAPRGKDLVSSAPIAEGIPRISTEATMRTKLKDLELPPEATKRMLSRCQQLGLESLEDLQMVEESTKLCHFFGGQYVAMLRTVEGIEIVGAADPGVRLAGRIARAENLSQEEKCKVSINLVPPGPVNGNERPTEFPTQFVGIDL
jgi:hypothetical protein